MAIVDPDRRQRYLDRVRSLALEQLRGLDVHVAIEPRGQVARATSSRLRSAMVRLRDAYEESTIPWIVDVVDLSECDEEFRARVRKEGIRWTACAND